MLCERRAAGLSVHACRYHNMMHAQLFVQQSVLTAREPPAESEDEPKGVSGRDQPLQLVDAPLHHAHVVVGAAALRAPEVVECVPVHRLGAPDGSHTREEGGEA